MLTAAERKMLDLSALLEQDELAELPEEFLAKQAERKSELARVTQADLQKTIATMMQIERAQRVRNERETAAESSNDQFESKNSRNAVGSLKT